MQRILKYIISENTTPVTILDFLKKEGFSRHILSSMKNTPNTIILNSERGFGRSVLKPQDHLIVTVPETESGENIIRTKMDLNIIYEDEDILVINKPADMPVHPSAGNYENTLANGIAWYFAEKGEDFVYRCINRLDRDTTGALILAKNPLSAAILSVQMKKRQILRTYLALVDGLLPDSGTLNAPIARMVSPSRQYFCASSRPRLLPTRLTLCPTGCPAAWLSAAAWSLPSVTPWSST